MKNLITKTLVAFMLATTLPESAIATAVPASISSSIASAEAEAPIFRRGKARQPRNRNYAKPHPHTNTRRNMRIQRRNGIGFQYPVISDQLAVAEGKEASNA